MTAGRPDACVRRMGTATLAIALGIGALRLLVPVASRGESPPASAAKPPVRVDQFGDPLPEGARLRIGSVRYRAGRPDDATLSPDGKLFATSSSGVVTLWDVASGRPLRHFQGAALPIEICTNQKLLCFSPDSKWLVGLGERGPALILDGGRPGTRPAVRVWDVASGEEIGHFDLLGGTEQAGYPPPARYVWFTPGGKEIGIILHSGVVRFLDLRTGKENHRWDIGKPLRDDFPGVATSSDGRLLSIVDPKDEDSLLLFVADTGRTVHRIKSRGELLIVAFSPDSTLVAAADANAVIRLFDVVTSKERAAFPTNIQPTGLIALAFSADGNVLYAGSQRGQVHRWRLPEGKALPALPEEANPLWCGQTGWLSGIFPTPDGRSVLSFIGYGSGLIRRWDTASGKEIPPPDGFAGTVSFRLSPDKRRLAAGDFDGKLALFDTATGRQVRLLRTRGSPVRNLSWSPDGKTLAVHEHDSVRLWDVRTGREDRVFQISFTREISRDDVPAFSPDGRYLLTSQHRLQMWDLAAGKHRWEREWQFGAALSPDGSTVATRDARRGLALLDAASGDVRASQDLRVEWFNGPIAFSPDGGYLATSHKDGVIRIHDPKTGVVLSRIKGPKGAGSQSLAFSPDGRWLLDGGTDNAMRLWEVLSGTELLHLTTPERFVAAEFGPGGRTAVSSSAESTILVWDLRPPESARSGDPAALWTDLASDDGAKVYRAVWALGDDPKSAVSLLRKKLPPVLLADEVRVRRLVRSLDADAFDEREKATRELIALGSPVVPLLKKLQGENPSAEFRRRLREIVEELTHRDHTDLRRSRAVQVLELAATPEARQLLRDWSAGASSVTLSDDARAALGRLERASKLRDDAGKP